MKRMAAGEKQRQTQSEKLEALYKTYRHLMFYVAYIQKPEWRPL